MCIELILNCLIGQRFSFRLRLKGFLGIKVDRLRHWCLLLLIGLCPD